MKHKTGPSHGTGTASEETVYAELVDAWWATPAGYGLSYDKLTHLSGQAAIDYQKKTMPDEEPYSDVYPNLNPRLRNVALSPHAVIHGDVMLGHGALSNERLTPDQLVERVQQHPRALVKMVIRTVHGRPQVVRVDEIYMP